MNLTTKLLAFTLIGAEWVLWLLLFLSLLSVAVMIERGLYYFSIRNQNNGLTDEIRKLLMNGKFDDARKQVVDNSSAVAVVARAGLEEAERGSEAA